MSEMEDEDIFDTMVSNIADNWADGLGGDPQQQEEGDLQQQEEGGQQLYDIVLVDTASVEMSWVWMGASEEMVRDALLHLLSILVSKAPDGMKQSRMRVDPPITRNPHHKFLSDGLAGTGKIVNYVVTLGQLTNYTVLSTEYVGFDYELMSLETIEDEVHVIPAGILHIHNQLELGMNMEAFLWHVHECRDVFLQSHKVWLSAGALWRPEGEGILEGSVGLLKIEASERVVFGSLVLEAPYSRHASCVVDLSTDITFDGCIFLEPWMELNNNQSVRFINCRFLFSLPPSEDPDSGGSPRAAINLHGDRQNVSFEGCIFKNYSAEASLQMVAISAKGKDTVVSLVGCTFEGSTACILEDKAKLVIGRTYTSNGTHICWIKGGSSMEVQSGCIMSAPASESRIQINVEDSFMQMGADIPNKEQCETHAYCKTHGDGVIRIELLDSHFSAYMCLFDKNFSMQARSLYEVVRITIKTCEFMMSPTNIPVLTMGDKRHGCKFIGDLQNITFQFPEAFLRGSVSGKLHFWNHMEAQMFQETVLITAKGIAFNLHFGLLPDAKNSTRLVQYVVNNFSTFKASRQDQQADYGTATSPLVLFLRGYKRSRVRIRPEGRSNMANMIMTGLMRYVSVSSNFKFSPTELDSLKCMLLLPLWSKKSCTNVCFLQSEEVLDGVKNGMLLSKKLFVRDQATRDQYRTVLQEIVVDVKGDVILLNPTLLSVSSSVSSSVYSSVSSSGQEQAVTLRLAGEMKKVTTTKEVETADGTSILQDETTMECTSRIILIPNLTSARPFIGFFSQQKLNLKIQDVVLAFSPECAGMHRNNIFTPLAHDICKPGFNEKSVGIIAVLKGGLLHLNGCVLKNLSATVVISDDAGVQEKAVGIFKCAAVQKAGSCCVDNKTRLEGLELEMQPPKEQEVGGSMLEALAKEHQKKRVVDDVEDTEDNHSKKNKSADGAGGSAQIKSVSGLDNN